MGKVGKPVKKRDLTREETLAILREGFAKVKAMTDDPNYVEDDSVPLPFIDEDADCIAIFHPGPRGPAGVIVSSPCLEESMPARPEIIAELVPALAGTENPFLLLEVDEEVYMQAMWTEEGYRLEYRDGSAKKHFVAKGYLSAEQAIETLSDYALQGKRWKTMHKYSRIKI